MTAYRPVRSIVRALRVLREVSEAGPVGASEIAARLGFPQPTVLRALETLLHEGYIYRKDGTARYGVTGQTGALSRGFNARSRLIDLALPIVEKLRGRVGWPSNLGVFDRDAMVIAYTNREPNAFCVPGRFGARIPMLVSGMGLAYLASVRAEARASILQRLSRSRGPWESDPRFWRGLESKLLSIQGQGYALAENEYLEAIYRSRIWAIAAPVLVDRSVEACISVLVLRSQFADRRTLVSLRKPLDAAAQELAKVLAGTTL